MKHPLVPLFDDRAAELFCAGCRKSIARFDSLKKAHHPEKAQPARALKETNRMKYMLMTNRPKTGYDTFGSWPEQDLNAHIAFILQIDNDLRASGELVYAEGLASPHEAKLVCAGADGVPVVGGGFPESKEYLAGYWIVEVASPERAYAIAAFASAAPGPGGAPMNMPIEVRQIMSGPPAE
jgi:hypothetical protein